MPEKDPKSPDTTSSQYDAMTVQWGPVNTLLEGVDAMRKAGETYLPRHQYEEDKRYDDRLASATLFNMTEKVLNSWVGKPFSQKIHFSDDTPGSVLEWSEDIDLMGNNMGVFLRRWFREGLSKAFAPILIEMPRPAKPPDGKERTVADDVAENIRPYWVFIAPENLIYAESTILNGREYLTHVRIKEIRVRRDGFAQVFSEWIRVFEAFGPNIPARVTLYEKVQEKSRKQKWVQRDQWDLGVDFIPIVTFYADRQDLMMGKSPLYDLAQLNVRHWQSNSDQISCLTVARFPILAISGGTDEDEVLKIGPYQWLQVVDPTGRAYYVEHTGRALAAGRQELLDLEEQMASYAVEMLKRKKQSNTATGRVLDNREATSPLEDMAIRFNDAVDLALQYTAAYAKIPTAGTVRISTEFALSKGDVEAFEFVKEGRRNKDISRRKFVQEGIRLGAFDEEFDLEENEEELEKEEDYGGPKEEILGKPPKKVAAG